MKTQPHNFEQVKDILDYGIEIHSQLRGLYARLSAESEHTRVKMLLDYLSRHERIRSDVMQRYGAGPNGQSLNVWLQYAPGRDIEKMLRECVIRPDMGVDDVIQTALAFDSALIEIYQQVSMAAQDTHAKALLDDLVAMEEQERQRFVRDAEWLNDM
jgi:hypothetical protein